MLVYSYTKNYNAINLKKLNFKERKAIVEYVTHDLLVDLPNDEPQDLTLNMLWFKDRDTNLVIARGTIDENGTLESTYKKQLNNLKQQVKALKSTEPQPILIGKSKDINALEIQSNFIRGKTHTFQYQLVCQVPNTQNMLALSYTKTTALNEKDKAHWQEIKDNLSFAN